MTIKANTVAVPQNMVEAMERAMNKRDEALKRVDELETAIRNHRAGKVPNAWLAQDRELYKQLEEVPGEPITPIVYDISTRKEGDGSPGIYLIGSDKTIVHLKTFKKHKNNEDHNLFATIFSMGGRAVLKALDLTSKENERA